MRVRNPAMIILIFTLCAVNLFSQPSQGKMVDIGSAKLFMNCTGIGSPTVILDAGAGAWSIHWTKVQAEIARTNRVCSYDRAGLGRSTAGKMPRTAKQAAMDLEKLLAKSNEKGPFILAGHSFGGYVVRMFRDANPDEVAGIALIDSAHEAQWERLPAAAQMLEFGIGAIRNQFAALNSGKMSVEEFPSRLPEPLLQEFRASIKQRKTQEELLSEMENSNRSAKRVGKTQSLGNLPLLVLSAGNSFAAFLPSDEKNKPMLDGLNKGWMELQAELSGLSANSQHLISRKSQHTINQDSPKLVAHSIHLVADMFNDSKRKGKR